MQNNSNWQISTTTRIPRFLTWKPLNVKGKTMTWQQTTHIQKLPLSTIIGYNKFSLDQSRGSQNYNQSLRSNNYSWLNNTIIIICNKDGFQNQQKEGLEFTKMSIPKVDDGEANSRIESGRVVELLTKIHHMKFEPKRTRIGHLIVLSKNFSL